MKLVFRVLAMAAVFCLMPVLHAAGLTETNLTGAWTGSFEFNGSMVPLTFNLKADGNALAGAVEGLPTTPAEIHDGKISGDTVTFWVNTDYQDQTYKLVYTGKVASDRIDFNFGTDDGGWSATLTVTRQGAAAAKPVDVTGAWKGTFNYDGNDRPLTFNLKSDGTTITGTVEGLGAAPVEIHDGKVDGDMVTFWLNSEYQGQTYALTYKGKIGSGQIDFDFGTADGSWGASLTAKKI